MFRRDVEERANKIDDELVLRSQKRYGTSS